MIPLAPDPGEPPPLAADEALWSKALLITETALLEATKGRAELPTSSLSVAACAARANDPAASLLVALVSRMVVRSEAGSERAIRCLRALARAGQPVDRDRLAQALEGTGRLPRIALAALAELAARDDPEALALVSEALDGPLRAEAAQLLSGLCSEGALDALAPRLRTPGPTGVHAAAALVAAEEDPFAFELLCERLCEPSDAVLAARALWGAAPGGAVLMDAHASLARWEARGVPAAGSGRLVAAALLTAGGRAQDVAATWRALASEDSELCLIGAEAAYALGDAQRARAAAVGLVRRGPGVAAKAFALLVSWADDGDEPALSVVRQLPESRPVELGRQAVLEALCATRRPPLQEPLRRAFAGSDRGQALDAARALAQLREPLALIPPSWL